jgi:PQQ-dependent dehydrogenase (methanol/ethanol family)
MRTRVPRSSVLLIALVGIVTCRGSSAIDDARLRRADDDPGSWLMYGRTYDDHHFSPLTQINDQTVGKLGLVWTRELGTTRGLEAAPVVGSGVIYTTSAWSVVYALDAKTGDVRWTYDPEVPRSKAYFICCDVVNRGVALYRGKVFVGTLDGRLIALDQHTGRPVWTVMTVEPGKAYEISAYPRIAKGLVLIGNSGGEYGVRGYITAYDAETGTQRWRTYTVPGNPANGFESKAMERAAATWDGEWWKVGGGGTAWEGINYDPDLDLLYFGTGNATAWYRALRNTGANKDNLYTASILAVRADDGTLVWHFQTTPGDNWDYDATQPLVRADLTIGGRLRKVIMQANKNGFFYVLDRQTGEFISGTKFVDGISWASGLDPRTGRPRETSSGYAALDPVLVSPDPSGAHTWTPMAFSPTTGLVYLGVRNHTTIVHAPNRMWRYDPNKYNHGMGNYEGPLLAQLAQLPPPSGELLAWDPVKGQPAWRVTVPSLESGGTLASAGNLVFHGRGDGIFVAYRASDGQPLWRFDAGTGIIGAPVSYMIGDTQYVTLLAGWGGGTALFNFPWGGKVRPGYGRILTFALGGRGSFEVKPFGHTEPPRPARTVNVSASVVHQGQSLYAANCMVCHGYDAVAGPIPDLRYAPKEIHDIFEQIVLGGQLEMLGMPSFKKILNADQVRAIQAYILSRADESGRAATVAGGSR